MSDEALQRTIAAVVIGLFLLANLILFVTGRFPVRQGGLADWSQTLGIIAAAGITLAIFSFLYRDNPLFRAVENLFVGLGLGVTVYIQWFNYLKPDIYDRLIRPLFSATGRVQPSDYWLLIPIFMGVLMLTRASRRHGWLSRYSICFVLGYGAGFAVQPKIHSLILKQMQYTMVTTQAGWLAWAVFGGMAVLGIAAAYYASKGGRLALVVQVLAGLAVLAYVVCRTTPLAGEREAMFRAVDALAIMLGVVSVLCYFFFSAEHRGVLGIFSRIGIMFLMVAFGATFGYTVMARESLLIGRFRFLLEEWLQAI